MKKKKLLDYFRNDLSIICVLYFFTYFLILLNDGVFWDGWTVFNVDKKYIISQFTMNGDIWFGYFISALFSLSKQVILFRIMTFLAYLLSTVFLFYILRNIKEIDRFSRFVIVALFAFFPLNYARICVATNSGYSLCHFLFFTAWLLISIHLKNRKIWIRLSAYPLLFLSFFMNSFLVFHGLIILYIFYIEKDNLTSVKRLFQKLWKNFDLIIAPFVFFVCKHMFLKPFGLVIGYNKITLKYILMTPYTALLAFKHSFVDVLKESFVIFSNTWFSALAITCLIFLFMKKDITKKITQERGSNNFKLFLFGILFFVLGSLAYLVVGKIPGHQLNVWHTRHEILLPLGASFLLYYGLKMIMTELGLNIKIQAFLYSFFISIFIITNFNVYLTFHRDWFKQLSLMESYKESQIIKQNTTFWFQDKAKDLNVNRAYRFYEFSGQMKYVFKDEKRLASTSKEEYKIINRFIPHSQYNISEYVPQPPQYKVTINQTDYDVSNMNCVKLIVLKFLKPKKYMENVKKIVKLDFDKL